MAHPPFDSTGLLIPGIHSLGWSEFVQVFGKNQHRQSLIKGLDSALNSLKTAGCKKIYIDGSFVTKKEFPGDYDACWDISGVNVLLLDPILLKFDDGRMAMKAKYLGDLFPAHFSEAKSGLVFLDFFQTERVTGDPKGIVTLDLGVKL